MAPLALGEGRDARFLGVFRRGVDKTRVLSESAGWSRGGPGSWGQGVPQSCQWPTLWFQQTQGGSAGWALVPRLQPFQEQ